MTNRINPRQVGNKPRAALWVLGVLPVLVLDGDAGLFEAVFFGLQVAARAGVGQEAVAVEFPADGQQEVGATTSGLEFGGAEQSGVNTDPLPNSFDQVDVQVGQILMVFA